MIYNKVMLRKILISISLIAISAYAVLTFDSSIFQEKNFDKTKYKSSYGHNEISPKNIEDKVKVIYAATEKGKTFIDDLDKFKKLINSSAANGQMSSKEEDVVKNSSVELHFIVIDENKQIEIKQFDFFPFSVSGQFFSSTNGVLKLENDLQGESALYSGMVFSENLIPSNLDLILEKGDSVQYVYTLSDRFLKNVLKYDITKEEGSVFLLERNEEVSEVEILSEYKEKVYLDENFAVVESFEDSNFVLFLGVTSGNAILSIETGDRKLTKVMNLIESQIHYQTSDVVGPIKRSYNLFTENILSKERTPYSVGEEDIKVFNTNILSNKLAYNNFEIEIPGFLLGQRPYFEISDGSKKTYFSGLDSSDIVLPTESLKQQFYDLFNDTSREKCIVQINLTKKVEEISVGQKNANGEIDFDILYLDQDGAVASEYSELTNRIYLSSDYLGTFYYQVKYLDGKVDLNMAYCGYSTYVVEQL
jgi:hypothetical protein